MPTSLVVVGTGILGCTAALLAADRGYAVRVLDRSQHPWSGASGAGEGKIHLGLIYALGDASTQSHIIEGALSFSRVIDRAAGIRLPWPDLAGEQFLNVIMPSSLLSADELAERYRELDDRFRASDLAADAEYLGAPIARLHEPGIVTEPLTGLAALRVAERAIEPARLRRILVGRLRAHPGIEVIMGRDVHALINVAGGVEVHHRNVQDRDGPALVERADAVLNCAWESQALLHADADATPLSLRFKVSLSIPRDALDPAACRTMTFVIGAFGDVVRRQHDVYASWYPAGRIINEQGFAPSAEALQTVASLDASHPIIDEQLDALIELGALPSLKGSARDRVQVSGGWIIAEGASGSATGAGDTPASTTHDIDQHDSSLHERRDGTIARRGRVVSPRNWKLSTAPLAALRAVNTLPAVLSNEVTS